MESLLMHDISRAPEEVFFMPTNFQPNVFNGFFLDRKVKDELLVANFKLVFFSVYNLQYFHYI